MLHGLLGLVHLCLAFVLALALSLLSLVLAFRRLAARALAREAATARRHLQELRIVPGQKLAIYIIYKVLGGFC